jgi:hypothetical protein
MADAVGTGFLRKMISIRGTIVFPLTGTGTDVVEQSHRDAWVGDGKVC